MICKCEILVRQPGFEPTPKKVKQRPEVKIELSSIASKSSKFVIWDLVFLKLDIFADILVYVSFALLSVIYLKHGLEIALFYIVKLPLFSIKP